MNIVGMSTATIETLVSEGFVSQFRDFYHLDDYKHKIVVLEGFGEKSYQKLMDAVEASRRTELSRVLYAMGIPNIGRQASRLICAEYPTPDMLEQLTAAELTYLKMMELLISMPYIM